MNKYTAISSKNWTFFLDFSAILGQHCLWIDIILILPKAFDIERPSIQKQDSIFAIAVHL